MAKIGIFSGTFDPVHQGHIAFCLEARRVCRLDRVVLLPERLPRSKQEVTPLSHRVALLRHAVEELPELQVVVLNTDQLTVKQTLPELQHLFDGAELTLLIGSDVVPTLLYRWEGLTSLFMNTSLAIGLRQTDTKEAVARVMQQLEREHQMPIRYTLIQSNYPDATSSHIRNGVYAVELSPKVNSYIRKHRLYE
jgi:nicotinate-nucleotide adenylyltransferase